MTSGDATNPADIVADLIRSRRTIEKFREECPPRETLLQAIELARWAPNHHHTQPWRFHLLGPQTVAAIVRLNTRLVREAKGDDAAAVKRERWSSVPGWMAVTCELADDSLRREEDYAACCCAIHNLSLYLWSVGIGVKWSTGPVTREPAFYDLLEVNPAQRRVVALLWYGYPAAIPEARRKAVEEIVTERP